MLKTMIKKKEKVETYLDQLSDQTSEKLDFDEILTPHKYVGANEILDQILISQQAEMEDADIDKGIKELKRNSMMQGSASTGNIPTADAVFGKS